MFQLTSHELDAYVEQTGFLKNTLEKMFRLLDVLSTLESNPMTKSAFVLKGGTALNLFILDFPRISIDIDLDYIRFVSKTDMLKDRKSVTLEIQKVFSSEYEIKISKDVHALAQFGFHYKTISKSNDMLKLEINYLRRLPLLEPQMRGFKQLDWDLNFLCLHIQELIASKTIALLNRYTPRDLFDVYQMAISPLDISKKLFRSLLLFYGVVSDIDIFELFKFKSDLITQKDVDNKLVPMLRKGIYPNRDEMVRRVEKFLSSYLVLTSKESESLRVFYDTGKFGFDSLIPQKEIQEKMKRSPSLKWKIQNIRRNF